MNQLFGLIGASERELASHKVEDLLGNYQSDGLTGIVQLNSGATRIAILLVEGMIILACRPEEERCERIAITEMEPLLPEPQCQISTRILPVEGVRIAKAMLEWYPPAESVTLKDAELSKQLNRWSLEPTVNVLHILWEQAEGCLLFPGEAPPSSAIYLTAGQQIRAGQAAIDAIRQHAAPSCTVIRYAAPQAAELPPEQIVPLRLAFAELVDNVIIRYTNLVGKGLSNTLILELNAKAQGNGWQIRISSSGVTDTHKFTNLEVARQSYRALLQELRNHMGLVVGTSLSQALLQETAIDLTPENQRALQTHRLLP